VALGLGLVGRALIPLNTGAANLNRSPYSFSYPHLLTSPTTQQPVSIQASYRLWQTGCFPQDDRACEQVARCWADASLYEIAANGTLSMVASTVRKTLALLRPRRQRPRCHAAESCDELASFHSITSSASASSLSGIWRPSALAVLRLMTSSNLVGCSTGRSPGLVPLRILWANTAARRKSS
jgi:hypothetical protein